MSNIATIGFFDGVHLGHKSLVAQLVAMAAKHHKNPIVFTFNQYPKQFFHPEQKLSLLSSLQERLEKLEQLNCRVVVLNFEQIHQLTAKQFMQQMLADYNIDEWLLGFNNYFGSDMLKQFEQYEQIASSINVQVSKAQPEYCENEPISSTRIRTALINGDIALANKMLGYDYTITGEVVHGRSVGRQLGFPTANIKPLFEEQLLPADGVYAGTTNIDGQQYPSLINIGCNPTFNNSYRSVEIHIPNFSANLYDKQISVSFVLRLREERRFDSENALRAQIIKDLKLLLNSATRI